jgi:hypothetical protein
VLKTYGKAFDVATSGHRVTSRLPVLRLRHLCRTYNNDDPSTSNSYAPLPYITEPRRIQMDQRLSDRTSVLASAAVGAWTSLVNSLRMLITIDARTYQPEKYYMRGPGPKWREKHARGHVSAMR